jgi:hypothetical protein
VNLYAILGALLVWGSSLAGTAWWFYGAGQDKEQAIQAREDRAAQVSRDAAASAAAAAISTIEVKHVTVTRSLEREVQTREVFRDCRSGPDALRLLNSGPAIAASGPDTAASGQLPASGPAGG